MQNSDGKLEDRAIDYVFKLMDISWWYYAVAIVLGVVVWKTWRWEGGLLVGYTFLVLVETLLIRRASSGIHFQPVLFWSWGEWAVQKNQILANVIMFVPVGLLAGSLWRWRGLWFAAGLSVIIEVLQLLTARGLCEFDDVIHNCLGTAVGIGIVMLIEKISRVEETE